MRWGRPFRVCAAQPLAPNLGRCALDVCAVISGAAGLVYQVAWAKALGLVFGHSAPALAVCLAVFLGGLALGSASSPGRSRHRRRGRSVSLLASYVSLELLVAVAGVASIPGLAVVQRMASVLPAAPAISRIALATLRSLGVTAVLGPATFFMGRTFPVLALAAPGAEATRRVARVYALNTFGACGGALLAGFILLPQLGLRATIGVAVALNLIAAAVASTTPAGQGRGPGEPQGPRPSSPGCASAPGGRVSPALGRRRRVAVRIVMGFTGAVALGYEVAWARLLGTVLGSSTYAITLMLAMVLAGIGLGAEWFRRWRRDHRATPSALAGVQLGTAAVALSFLLSFRVLPPVTSSLLRAMGSSFASWTVVQAVVCGLAELPTATLLGFAFPLMVDLMAPRRTPGAEPVAELDAAVLGHAYGSNTAGAIGGALVASFLLLPAVGAYRLVALAATLNAAVALSALVVARRREDLPRLIAAFGAGGWLLWFALGGSPLPASLSTFGAALYGELRGSELTFEEVAGTEDVVFAADGPTATVAVTQTESYVGLKVNGKVDASSLDRSTQLLLGYLGGVLHPNPRRVLVIGFGSGMTVSALARLPDIERIDCVEIEPAVLRAATALQSLNRGVLSDPRLRVVIEDARSFVQASGEPYDIVVSEPSNPWIAGVASLFTDEFYGAVRRRLAPGGMFVQWLQAYALETRDVQMVTGTLARHFSDLSLWRTENRDFILLGRTLGGPLDLRRARATWARPELAEDLRALHLVAPESWLSYLRLGDREARELSAEAPVSTDDRTPLEYRAPTTLMNDDLVAKLEALVEQAQREPFGGEVASEDLRSAAMASAASLLEMKSPWAARPLAGLAQDPATATLEILRGRWQLAIGRDSAALAHFDDAERLGADAWEIQTWRAAVARWQSDLSAAASRLDDALERCPRYAPALELSVTVARERGRFREAIAAKKTLLTLRPPEPGDLCELGDLLLRSGDRGEAQAMLHRGLSGDHYAFLCRRDLGELERAESQPAAARSDLDFVVQHFPLRDSSVYRSLSLLERAEGHAREAEAILAKGRRLFPADMALAAAMGPGR